MQWKRQKRMTNQKVHSSNVYRSPVNSSLFELAYRYCFEHELIAGNFDGVPQQDSYHRCGRNPIYILWPHKHDRGGFELFGSILFVFCSLSFFEFDSFVRCCGLL